MEFTPLIPKPFLARAKGAEVLRRLGHHIAIELEDDSSGGACAGQSVRAKFIRLGTCSGRDFTVIHSKIEIDL